MPGKTNLIVIILLTLLVGVALGHTAPARATQTEKTIAYRKIVDLSHDLAPDMPVWPGDPPMTIEKLADIEADGYYLNAFTIGEHSGTHVGSGAHFNQGEKTIDQLMAEDLIKAAVVIDVVKKVEQDADYQLSKGDIAAWEEKNGEIPPDSVVILYTGWQERWGDQEAFFNVDEEGLMHFPGFGAEAAAFLLDERKVVGLGIDTHGIDAGLDETFTPNTLLLQENRFHLENLTNLDRLPPTGATLVIGALKIENGSGSPARIFAFVP